MKEYLLGVDVGTQATKGTLVRPSGEVVAVAAEEYEVLHPRPLWAEQWPEVWLQAVGTVIRALLTRAGVSPKEVTGVCISGLYGGSGIPLDAKMKPIRPCLIWMDRRATAEVEWIKANVDLDKLFLVTGNWVDSYFGYTKILWIKRHEPANWRRISLFLPPNCYINFRLTGQVAIDHSSAGNLGGLYDIRTHAWSEEMAQALGLPLELMPEKIVASGEVIGEVTREGAQLTGLAPGTPVLAGGVDAPMATLAAGALTVGDNVTMMGTSTCWGVIHAGEGFARELVSMPHVVEATEKFYTWGGSATSGALARWFRDELGQAEVARGLGEGGKDPYQFLDDLARAVPPGCEGLLALPYFMGERAPLWDPSARGAWVGLTLSHTKGHLFRALLEAAGFALRHAIEVGEEIGLPISKETMVVGGVAKSPLWLSIIADITGRAIRTPATEGIEAPLADALLVGLAMGLVDRYERIREWISYGEPVLPHPERHAIYDRWYALYRQLYQALRPLFSKLQELPGDQAKTR
ncbi:MAG: FGGY-family carbohydrate kinase [Candidatus Acetothermia bacterium]|jgi:xylulokinase|nr:FGGY-family carbohydrate kinase [Candidatus Acetothermia bacterium]MDH7505655.1 FGGY-family carbohydrate kinase [Candidatus Acetothermia bacterium]